MEFETGAIRDDKSDKNRPDLIPPEVKWRLGWHYKNGADHYGEHNWEKGIPDSSFIQSAERHWLQYQMGDKSEDHLAALVFNIFGLMYNEIRDNHDYIDPAWFFDAR